MITYTTAGPWPSTLRLSGLTTHKSPAYKNLAHQPIKHNYNFFQNMVYNGARPWGHYICWGSTILAEVYSFVFDVVALLHAITASGKSFQWVKNQQKAFDELKRKISQAPLLALPNLQKPFEVETYASGYAMGAILMQGGRPVCYHSEVFHGAVLNYPN
jgi:hypothetical protein